MNNRNHSNNLDLSSTGKYHDHFRQIGNRDSILSFKVIVLDIKYRKSRIYSNCIIIYILMIGSFHKYFIGIV